VRFLEDCVPLGYTASAERAPEAIHATQRCGLDAHDATCD
jgi:hypothetical protein